MVIEITVKDTDEKKEYRNQHVDEDGLMSLLIAELLFIWETVIFYYLPSPTIEAGDASEQLNARPIVCKPHCESRCRSSKSINYIPGSTQQKIG